jgi:two-component system, LuxR family, response regulator DctR
MSMAHPLPDVSEDGGVHLVDDEAPVRDALAFLFASHGLAVQVHDGGASLLTALDGGAQPGCILLDVRMEPLSGLQVHDELLVRGMRTPVIFLTGHGDIPMAVDALKKGAFDFVEKPFSDQALVKRVQRALAVSQSQRASHSADAECMARLASLTERERAVMRRVAAGLLNKLIADELGISMRTVEVHRARVYAKLGVRSSAELATLLAQAWRGQASSAVSPTIQA